MILLLQTANHRTSTASCLAIFLLCIFGSTAPAQNVILHLKDGDQISGLIISENTNQVVISNAWVKALSVPLSSISKRETVSVVKTPPPVLAVQHPVAVVKPSVKLPKKTKGKWRGEARVGFDTIVSTTDQQDYSAHLQLTYERPYDSNPKQAFQNTSTFDGEYQKTDGQESANHASANNKSDFDIGDKIYGYGLFGFGYDDVQKIDFQYQVGPGLGWHFIKNKTFVMDLEGGVDYEAQYLRDTSNLQTFYSRLAENFTWNIQKNLKLTENFAFYPDLEHGGQYRNEFASTLSYGFWKNLSLNLTVLNNYNTEVAPGVDQNQFEVRSSLGVTF